MESKWNRDSVDSVNGIYAGSLFGQSRDEKVWKFMSFVYSKIFVCKRNTHTHNPLPLNVDEFEFEFELKFEFGREKNIEIVKPQPFAIITFACETARKKYSWSKTDDCGNEYKKRSAEGGLRRLSQHFIWT